MSTYSVTAGVEEVDSGVVVVGVPAGRVKETKESQYLFYPHLLVINHSNLFIYYSWIRLISHHRNTTSPR